MRASWDLYLHGYLASSDGGSVCLHVAPVCASHLLLFLLLWLSVAAAKVLPHNMCLGTRRHVHNSNDAVLCRQPSACICWWRHPPSLARQRTLPCASAAHASRIRRIPAPASGTSPLALRREFIWAIYLKRAEMQRYRASKVK